MMQKIDTTNFVSVFYPKVSFLLIKRRFLYELFIVRYQSAPISILKGNKQCIIKHYVEIKKILTNKDKKV